MEYKIEIKLIDFPYYTLKDNIITMFLIFIISPLFYLYLKTGEIWFIWFNILLCIFLDILFFVFYIFIIKLKRKEKKILLFEENKLIIKYGQKVKEIYYTDIEMIFIRKNLFGSGDIIINFPTARISLRDIENKGYFDEKNSLILSNIINYKEIKKILLKKVKFEKFNIKGKRLLFKRFNISYFQETMFVVILFYFFYDIKQIIFLPLLLFLRVKNNKYKVKIGRDLKIYSKRKELYLKSENYMIKDEKIIKLKIKNMDRLYGNNENFVPLRYEIIE